MDDRVKRLASVLGIAEVTLGRHLQPLAAPEQGSLDGWNASADLQQIHSISDGFRLFGPNEWNGFAFLNAADYRLLRRDYIFEASLDLGIVPIFGEGPHLSSVRVSDGVVVSTDWECEGDVEGGAWLKPIAPSIPKYVATVIEVREAYGLDDSQDATPSDWWHPYASHGDRYDLESKRN